MLEDRNLKLDLLALLLLGLAVFLAVALFSYDPADPIGELVRRTGDDLLECKNFGVTSLNEIREKLTIQSLKLRGD